MSYECELLTVASSGRHFFLLHARNGTLTLAFPRLLTLSPRTYPSHAPRTPWCTTLGCYIVYRNMGGGGNGDGPRAARAQDDLYAHVNAAWLQANPVPPEYGRWGVFEALADDALHQTRQVLEDAGPADKAGAWLVSGLNAAAQDSAAALAPVLALANALAAASVGTIQILFFPLDFISFSSSRQIW